MGDRDSIREEEDDKNILLRSSTNRLMFNPTRGFQWQHCMDTCPKYRRAQPASFASIQEMEEFFQWSTVTTKDPDTFEYYPDVNSEAFWMPYRWGDGSYLATT